LFSGSTFIAILPYFCHVLRFAKINAKQSLFISFERFKRHTKNKNHLETLWTSNNGCRFFTKRL